MKHESFLQVLLSILIIFKFKMIFYSILILTIMYLLLAQSRPEPILGIYEQSYWLTWVKQLFMFVLIRINKRRKENAVGNKDAGFGLKAHTDVSIMENPQPLQEHPLACDAVWFGGGSKNSVYLVISGARRKLGILQSMVFLYIPEIGLLSHENHPETAMEQSESEVGGWSGGGVNLVCVEPMKKWEVSFEGTMVNKEEEESSHHVKISATYTSDLPYFDFDAEMNPWTVARAMAKEPWSKDYFDRLRAAHQNHYEQFGDVTGYVDIDGKEYDINVSVMRDHTHGSVRDWRLLHRYCFHQFTTLSGLRGFLGVVSQPGTLSMIEMGWVYNRGEKFPVEEVTLEPWNLGENGKDASDYGFRFKAGGEWFDVQVTLTTQARGEAMFGSNWEARVIERFCRYV